MEQAAYLIDANVILELVLAQERGEECALFFNAVADREIAVAVTAFSLYAVEIIASTQGAYDRLEIVLQQLRELTTLAVYRTTLEEEIEIARIARGGTLDFDDALQWHVAKKLNAILVSFDRHFDATDVKRVEPSGVLSH